jgi:hypothetical protein
VRVRPLRRALDACHMHLKKKREKKTAHAWQTDLSHGDEGA